LEQAKNSKEKREKHLIKMINNNPLGMGGIDINAYRMRDEKQIKKAERISECARQLKEKEKKESEEI
jgi:hypothetical protein